MGVDRGNLSSHRCAFPLTTHQIQQRTVLFTTPHRGTRPFRMTFPAQRPTCDALAARSAKPGNPGQTNPSDLAPKSRITPKRDAKLVNLMRRARVGSPPDTFARAAEVIRLQSDPEGCLCWTRAELPLFTLHTPADLCRNPDPTAGLCLKTCLDALTQSILHTHTHTLIS